MADDDRGILEQSVLAYLQTHRVMTLATLGPEGVWASAVFYANDAFDLFFLSAGHTRHGQNLVINQRAAATIQEDYTDWPEIKGIQLEGLVYRLEGTEQRRAIDLYQLKYPFIATAGAKMRSALARVHWYHLQPDKLYFIDNSKGLGHRDQIIPGPAGN